MRRCRGGLSDLHRRSQDEVSFVWSSTPRFTFGKLVFFVVRCSALPLCFIKPYKNRYLPPATFLAHIVVRVHDRLPNRVSRPYALHKHSVAHVMKLGHLYM